MTLLLPPAKMELHMNMQGKDFRRHVPRSAHGDWSPAPARPAPVDVITSQDAARLPWLIPIRHERMSVSPLAFFRATAKLMALDLADTPSIGVHPQICGDAHLSNFGFYGSPERDLVFDINDFDETLPGPWEWDVKRLAASFAITARNNGMSSKNERALALTSSRAYRLAMRRLANAPYLDIWYSRINTEDLEVAFEGHGTKKDIKRYRKEIQKTKSKDSRHALAKLAEETESGYRIKSQPPLILPLHELEDVAHPEALRAEVTKALEDYLESVPDQIGVLLRRFDFVDLAVKVVGVGSVGTRCFIVLLMGRDAEPLFLQVKEATRSVLEDHLPPSRYPQAGRRVVEGQRLMQAVSDIFLGWTEADASGHQYYWRQLKDMKGSVEVENMDADRLHRYAQLCGWTLARAHARSADPRLIATYLGKASTFDEAIGEFAVRYADQNDRDYREFKEAIDSGVVSTHT